MIETRLPRTASSIWTGSSGGGVRDRSSRYVRRHRRKPIPTVFAIVYFLETVLFFVPFAFGSSAEQAPR